MDSNYLNMKWQNGFEATLDARVVLSDTYIPMTPVPTGDFGRLVLEDTSKENFEIIRYSSKDAHGVFVESISGGLRNEDGNSTGIHPRGARIRANITAQDLREFRAAAKAVQDAFTSFIATLPDWRPIATVPTLVSNNGGREYLIRYTGTNLVASLSDMTKLRIPRTVAPPTQSMRFISASNQYADKASPANITFGDTYTTEAWVYIDSYGTAEQWIIDRISSGGTDGWGFDINPQGQVGLRGIKAGNGDRRVRSYVSAAQGRWVHIAAAITHSTNSGKVWIDGAVVSSFMSGTNASGTSQPAVNMTVGQFTTGGGGNVNMKIAHLRVWNTFRTDAEIRNNMNQDTLASTTGLVAWYKGNGSWNDSSVNANHLTAGNGAVNNFALHPFNAIEYATVKPGGVTFAGGNTDVLISTLTGAIPAETLAASSYSTVENPYGFPSRKFDIAANAQDFSLAEVDTGNVWIDGKKIYKATYIASYTSAGTSETALNINVPLDATRIIKIEGGLTVGTDLWPFEYMNPAATTAQNSQMKIRQLSGVWQIAFFSGASGNINLTTYYIK